MKFALRTSTLALSLAFGLVACGGSGNSGGSSTPTVTSSSGTLVDDIVIGATVFCDSDNNGVFDELTEAATATGDDGRFTFSPACEAPIVSVPGTGYDRTTLKSLKVAFRAATRSAIVSPFTTMQLGSGLSADDFKAVMAKLGLGSSDARNYHPTEAQTAVAAAAVAKLLNDIALAIDAAGGDPKPAYEAAAAKIAALIAASPSSAPLDDDVSLGDIIGQSLGAALDTVPNLSPKAKTNLQRIALAGIKTVVKSIKSKGYLRDTDDDFRSDKTGNVIGNTNLDDDDESDAAEQECGRRDNIAQYVYSADNQVTLQSGATETSVTMAQFQATGGVTMPTGLTLGTLDSIGLPMRTTPLGLSKRGSQVPLAIEVTEVAPGHRKLQVIIDQVNIATDPAAPGQVVATVPVGAKMHFYARTESGVSIETGRNPIVNASANNISSGGVINVDIGLIRTRLLAGLGSGASATFDKMLAAKGSFDVTLVIGELDVRAAPVGSTVASPLPVKRISVTNAQNKGKGSSKPSVTGASVSGRLNF
ncbi:MAG: hypothetical protein IPG93_05305 [Burkholderiales bacterium]|nr:hypothetical protein [Burkholderiales bacterium]